MSDRARRFIALLREAPVYAITDEALEPERLLQILGALLDAGIRLVQYRDKVRTDRERAAISRALADRVHTWGGLLIVNDRADLAIAATADGAHLGQSDLPLEAGRAMLGPDLLLGASASYLEELTPEMLSLVDYVGFGTVFPTETKADAEYAGLDLLEQACRATTTPILGIGGVTIDRVPAVIERGAMGVAVVSALFRAPDPAAAAQALIAGARQAWSMRPRC